MRLEHLLFTLLALIVILLIFPRLDRDNPKHRSWIAFCAIVLFVRYIFWRTNQSILIAPMPTFEGFWIWICFINEIFIFIETGAFYLLLSKNSNRLKEADRYEKILRALPVDQLPTVDVFIPSYNEGLDVLERSIIGALHLDWPKEKLKVWVLDDGKRDWLRDFAMSKGAGYIRRADNVHAKAGNLNHASMLTNGKFVMTLDADFVPFRNFLFRTVGFFIDPKIAIVQTPQHFFNKDFVQTNLHLHSTTPDEQRLFFDVMMPARDGWDAAFWCGSCSVARRTALEDCGGVPTKSITEDLLTTLTLLRHGYLTRYLNEKLSHGIAPEKLDRLMIQRERWCRGTIQAFYSDMGPLGPNLSFVHRILFFPVYWVFSPITRVMAHIIPIVFLWFGFPAVYIEHYSEIINFQLPVIFFNFAYERWVMPAHFVPLINTASNTLNSLQVLPTVINSLINPHKKGFGVTPKGKDAPSSRVTYHPFSFWSSTTLLVLTIGGVLVSLSPELSKNSSDAFFPVAASWSVFNCIILLLMIFLSIEHPKKRVEERFTLNHPSHLEMRGESYAGVIVDMSQSGCRVHCETYAHEGEVIKVDVDGVFIAGRVIYSKNGEMRLTFLDMAPDQRDHVIRFLFTGKFDNAPKGKGVTHILKGLFHRAFGNHEHLYKA